MKKARYRIRPSVLLVAYAIVALALILTSYMALEIPVVAVGAIVILETLLATLLNKTPLWIHGLIGIAQIIAGICFGKVVFMILMVVVYAIAVALLYYVMKEK